MYICICTYVEHGFHLAMIFGVLDALGKLLTRFRASDSVSGSESAGSGFERAGLPLLLPSAACCLRVGPGPTIGPTALRSVTQTMSSAPFGVGQPFDGLCLPPLFFCCLWEWRRPAQAEDAPSGPRPNSGRRLVRTLTVRLH